MIYDLGKAKEYMKMKEEENKTNGEEKERLSRMRQETGSR